MQDNDLTTPWKLPEPLTPEEQAIGATILTRQVLAVVNGDEPSVKMYESMPTGKPEF